MSTRRHNLFGAALVVSLVVGGSALVEPAAGQATQPAAGADASDIDFGRPPRYPQAITPTVEGGQLLDTHHGEAMRPQEFTFNPATREIALVRPIAGKTRAYADARIDSAIYKTDLSLFELLTHDRAPIGKIVLLSAGKKINITPTYVVIPKPDKPTPIDPASYRAMVTFVKGEESSKPGTTVTMRRNAEAPVALADTEFTKISRKNDVITWSVERGGAVVKTGSFGFPIVATEPELLKYVIQLP